MLRASTTREPRASVAPIGSLALAGTILPPLGGLLLLGTMNHVGPWLAGLGWLGVGIYILGFVILAGLALLPTYAQAVLGGWAFGIALGLPAALLGFTGAAFIAYLIATRVDREQFANWLDAHRTRRKVHRALLGSSFIRTVTIITLLRLPPTSPFALTNFLLSGTRVSLRAYLLGTAIGMAPRSAVAIVLGAGLVELNLNQLDQAVPWLWGLLLSLAMMIILGLYAKRVIDKMPDEEPPTAVAEVAGEVR